MHEMTSSVGPLLRQQRQSLGLSLEEVAGRTRIRTRHLAALEDERFDTLPGEAYLVGFLRSYAQALGLDPDGVLHRYHQQTAPLREPDDPETVSPRGAGGWRIFGIFAVLGAGLAIVALLLLSDGSDATGGSSAEQPSTEVIAVTEETAPSQSDASGPETAMPPRETTPGREKPLVNRGPAPGVPHEAAPGTILRVEATGDALLEVSVDSLSPRSYRLQKGTVLFWRPETGVRLHADPPAAVRTWIDDDPQVLIDGELILSVRAE